MAILTARFEADLSDVGDDPGDWTDPQVTLSFFDNVGYTSDSGRFYSDFVRASFADEPDYRNQWLGSGLVFDPVNGRLTAGTVTGFVQEERVNGVWQETFSVESFSVDAVQVSNAMNSQTGDLVQALIETIFSGDDTFNLSPEADNVDAFGGNDVVNGGAGNDTLRGGAGNDRLSGGQGNDSLLGGAGGDLLVGNAGSDLLDGGAITDLRNYLDANGVNYADAAAGVNVNLASGRATDGFGGIDTLRNIDVVNGSHFADRLTGSSRLLFESFAGGDGNDTIDGGAITDTLNLSNTNRADFSSSGAITVDLLAGTAVGQGNDRLININFVGGSNAGDRLYGSNRSDVAEAFEGRAGNDTIDGRGGLDVVFYTYASAGVNVNLATGVGFVSASDRDTLAHIEGIRGSHYADTLIGGLAANAALEAFLGNGGNDTIDGGAGYDRVDYVNAMQAVTVRLGGAAAGSATDGLPILDGKLVYPGTDGAVIGRDVLRHIEGVRGSDFGDTLTGSAIATEEVFEGRGGNDRIDGGGGIDRAGYYQALAGATVQLGLNGAAGSAADGYGTTDLLRNIENVQGSRDFADRITGNEGANRLDGVGGNDTLAGGGGNDTLLGGGGNDSLSGGSGNDSLLGGNGNDMLDGGSGVDRMTGGLGNDTYVIDDTRDGVVEAAAGGVDTVRIGRDYTLLANFENLVLTGSGANDGAGNSAGNRITGNAAVNRLSGGGGNDALTGGAGNDVVLGGSGNDTLAGGFGNDMLTGGSGRDAFLFDRALNATTNVDRIADFIAVDDRLLLDDAVFAGIGPLGALAAGAFRAGVSARDASDRIVYDAAAGRLWFDADGNGAGAATLFATVAPGTALTVGDIFVV